MLRALGFLIFMLQYGHVLRSYVILIMDLDSVWNSGCVCVINFMRWCSTAADNELRHGGGKKYRRRCLNFLRACVSHFPSDSRVFLSNWNQSFSLLPPVGSGLYIGPTPFYWHLQTTITPPFLLFFYFYLFFFYVNHFSWFLKDFKFCFDIFLHEINF